jgi:hypothetical protein
MFCSLSGSCRKMGTLNRFTFLLIVQIVSLLMLFLLQSLPTFLVLRMIFGVLSLTLIPGYCLVRFLPIILNKIEIIGFALIIGLTYQLICVYFTFFFSFLLRQFPFQYVISLLSLLPILLARIAKRNSEISLVWNFKRGFSNFSYILFCVLLAIGLLGRIYYQGFSINPHTDTALFGCHRRVYV